MAVKTFQLSAGACVPCFAGSMTMQETILCRSAKGAFNAWPEHDCKLHVWVTGVATMNPTMLASDQQEWRREAAVHDCFRAPGSSDGRLVIRANGPAQEASALLKAGAYASTCLMLSKSEGHELSCCRGTLRVPEGAEAKAGAHGAFHPPPPRGGGGADTGLSSW